MTLLSSYEYDPKGLRTKKVEGGIETRFLLDGGSVLSEFGGANTATRRYLQNPEAIDDILGVTEGGAAYFPLTDALGSVVAITDSAGAVVKRNNYEVYGARSTTGSGPDWAFGFTGREQDASGWRYHRDRYASAATGVWSQADRAGFVDGPSRYGYVKSKPTTFLDPRGQSSLLVARGLADGAFGEAFGAALIYLDLGLNADEDSGAFAELAFTYAAYLGALAGVAAAVKSSAACTADEVKLAQKVGLNAKSENTVQLMKAWNMKVADFIGAARKGGIKGEFPAEYLNKTVGEALQSGGTTVRKLLTDSRWMK